ncbi:ethylbenzene dehydrogenase-related protein [Halorhodospira halochloris]|uniref:ethylbenzene dehydrogenase-related protein n=1 Tax=Halorhodospira halochloris TaxID=1052 RepID=UPI001EE7A139|nr:ethylbenzene dehydrogenase-related protein [Halorhodospira halochloris]MCG5548506.1 ethylbenzene dehydrogenase-related protein [Halorhodospira halochloris]
MSRANGAVSSMVCKRETKVAWLLSGRLSGRGFRVAAVISSLVLLGGTGCERTGDTQPEPDAQRPDASLLALDLFAVEDPERLEVARRIEDLSFGEPVRVTAFYPNQANRLWLANAGEGRQPSSGYHSEAETGGHQGWYAFEPGNPTGCWNCHADPDYGHGGIDSEWDWAASNPFEMGVDLSEAAADYDKPGTRELELRAARDAEYLYIHASWTSNTDASGRDRGEPGPNITHQTYRWDADEQSFGARGEQRNAGSERAEPVAAEDLPAQGRFDYEERLVAMSAPAADPVTDEFDGGESGNFNAQGCFMACHDDLRYMPGAYEPEASDVEGTLLEGQSDMRHYTLNSRDLEGQTPDDYRVAERLASRYEGRDTQALVDSLKQGRFLDLFQVRMGRSAPMGHASGDYVYHYREGNNALVEEDERFSPSGRGNWRNQDPGDGVEGDYLRYVYDPRETGFWGLDEDEFAKLRRAGLGPLIVEPGHPRNNAIDLAEDDHLIAWDGEDYVLQKDFGPYGDAGDALGDILDDGVLIPRRVMQEAEGARSSVWAFTGWTETEAGEGRYDVVVVRPLEPRSADGGLITDHDLGKALDRAGMTFGFGIHDDHTGNRSHYVTLPVGLVAEGEEDAYLAAVASLYDTDEEGLRGRLPVIEVAGNE